MKFLLCIYIVTLLLFNLLHAEETPSPWPEEYKSEIILDEASFLNVGIHNLALQLLNNFSQYEKPTEPIAVTTFVDLNYLYRTSPLGRYIAEQLMGELQRAGFNVVEIRKAHSIMTKEHYGEYILSRDINEIRRDYNINMVLLGTYLVRDKYVFINARIVDGNNFVRSSAMRIIRRDPLVDSLLKPSTSPPIEPSQKITVKGFGETVSSTAIKEEIIPPEPQQKTQKTTQKKTTTK